MSWNHCQTIWPQSPSPCCHFNGHFSCLCRCSQDQMPLWFNANSSFKDISTRGTSLSNEYVYYLEILWRFSPSHMEHLSLCMLVALMLTCLPRCVWTFLCFCPPKFLYTHPIMCPSDFWLDAYKCCECLWPSVCQCLVEMFLGVCVRVRHSNFAMEYRSGMPRSVQWRSRQAMYWLPWWAFSPTRPLFIEGSIP